MSSKKHPLKIAGRLPLAAGVLLLLSAALARADDLPSRIDPPVPDPSVADLAKPGPLGDMTLGKAEAPVTIVEYASMACTHCAHFAVTTFPDLKTRYIDTGKVRYILREFPLDALSEAAFMQARCAPHEKYFDIVATLFAKQHDWVAAQPLDKLKVILKPFGIDDKAFDACLVNQKIRDAIEAVSMQGAGPLAVNATPTFFVNGKRLVGDQSIDQMAAAIDAAGVK